MENILQIYCYRWWDILNNCNGCWKLKKTDIKWRGNKYCLSLILAHLGSDLLWITPILPWTWIFPFPHFHSHWHVGLSMRWRSIFTRSKNIPLSLASIRAKPSCFGISLDWRLIPCDVTSQLNHAQLPTHGRVEARAEERKVETGGNSCRCRSRQRVG